MKVIPFFFLFLCLSCSFDTKSNKQNTSYIILNAEGFEKFIKQFSSDKVFQLSRIKFPLVVETVEADLEHGGNMDKKSLSTIEKLDWDHYYYDERDFPDEKVKVIINEHDNKSCTIVIRGVNNGIAVTHFFENTELGWFLVKITDASD